MSDIKVDQVFKEVREDLDCVFYGSYFTDVADYYTRENNDEKEMLKLLYMSLKALTVDSIPNELVQYIFEMKTLVVNGEFPGVLAGHDLLDSTVYTIQYVQNAPIEKLYTFKVSDEVLAQLEQECAVYRNKYIGHNFKSLDILKNCRLKN